MTTDANETVYQLHKHRIYHPPKGYVGDCPPQDFGGECNRPECILNAEALRSMEEGRGGTMLAGWFIISAVMLTFVAIIVAAWPA